MGVQEPLIRLNKVRKVYPQGRTMVEALRGVSLWVEPGEKLALMGPSGSGKSTLLAILGLLDVPDGGSYTVLGRDPQYMSDLERSRLRGEALGFVFQSFNLIPQLKAWENVALPLKYQGVGLQERRRRSWEMLEQVGLADRAEHYPSELSGGQEQRVAIARALVVRPKIILADEPTGNLDSASGKQILRLLDEAHSFGTTLVIVTHSLEVAARASRIVHLIDGQVRES